MDNQKFLEPKTVEETLQLLDSYGSEISLIAGGTDLILDFQNRSKKVGHIASILEIKEMSHIEWKEGLNLGACTTFNQICHSAIVLKHYKMLAEAVRCIGSRQIRNIATIGGNLCNALPCADSIPPLVASDAVLVINNINESRQVPLSQFITGPRQTVLESHEMVSTILLPEPLPHTGSAYKIQTTRKALDLTVVGIAAALTLAEDGETIIKARIALGNCSPVPMRALEAEEYLTGEKFSPERVREAALLAARSAKVRDSRLRASADYRRAMVEVLTRRALQEAFEHANSRRKITGHKI